MPAIVGDRLHGAALEDRRRRIEQREARDCELHGLAEPEAQLARRGGEMRAARRHRPAEGAVGARRVRRSATLELAMGAAVLAVTAVLVATPTDVVP